MEDEKLITVRIINESEKPFGGNEATSWEQLISIHDKLHNYLLHTNNTYRNFVL